MLSEKLEFSLANNSSIAELEFTFSFNRYLFNKHIEQSFYNNTHERKSYSRRIFTTNINPRVFTFTKIIYFIYAIIAYKVK